MQNWDPKKVVRLSDCIVKRTNPMVTLATGKRRCLFFDICRDRFLRCYNRNLKKSGGVAGVEAETEETERPAVSCLEEALPNATPTPAPSLSSQPLSGVELVGKCVRVWWRLDQK